MLREFVALVPRLSNGIFILPIISALAPSATDFIKRLVFSVCQLQLHWEPPSLLFR
jgi:hypothetical protein